MSDVDVLKEILDWSQTRPSWQRDALRRLVAQGELLEADISDLAEICKGGFGLVDKCSSNALARTRSVNPATSVEVAYASRWRQRTCQRPNA